MTFLTQNCFRSGRGTAFSGSLCGFGLTLAYALVFALYAIVRSSGQIATILTPAEGLFGTLIANAFAMLVSVLGFALPLGIIAAVVVSFTWLLVYGLTMWLNPQQAAPRAAGIGFMTAIIPVGGLLVWMQQSLGIYFNALWPSGFLFWFGLPSLLFVGATTWISWQAAGHALKRPVGLVSAAA